MDSVFFPFYIYLKKSLDNVPDKTTRSCTLRPLIAKFWTGLVKLEKREGILAKASEIRDTLPSLLPVRTSHNGLWNCKVIFSAHSYMLSPLFFFSFKAFAQLTFNETESLAAKVRTSAQDTIPVHFFFTSAFILSMTSKPDKVRFGIACFSVVLLLVEFNKIEASQP